MPLMSTGFKSTREEFDPWEQTLSFLVWSPSSKTSQRLSPLYINGRKNTICIKYKILRYFSLRTMVNPSALELFITLTSPCNEKPWKTPLYIGKSGLYRGTIFSYFCSKTWIVSTCSKCLVEAVLSSTNNLCLDQKWGKISSIII